MSKWFTWEPSTGGSLLLKATVGPKTSTWKIRKSTSQADLYEIFSELAFMLDPGDHTPKLLPMSLREGLENQDALDSWELSNPSRTATSEEESLAALTARANSLNLASAGGKWWDGEAEDLPLRIPAGQKAP